MAQRSDLQALLELVSGISNVYFQPPESLKIKYPCIVYSRSSGPKQSSFADDMPYTQRKLYQVIVIDGNPDSAILDKIASLPLCSFDRHYTSNNLNHDVYNLYY
jgi:hypothetical protein